MSHHRFAPNEILPVRHALLSWYDVNKRKLPWRDWFDADQNVAAYRVLVSELMLQQTTVTTVLRYYDNWMKLWPTIESLANAVEEIVNDMNGIFPADVNEMIKLLPPNPVLDGNVMRVLCRLRAVGGDLKKKSTTDLLWSLATDLVCTQRPGDLNQSLIELGATVCTPSNPKCDSCPVQNFCCAYKQDDSNDSRKDDCKDIEECDLCLKSSYYVVSRGVKNYPRKTSKPKQRNETSYMVILYTIKNDKLYYFMLKQKQTRLLSGLWTFLEIDGCDGANSKKSKIDVLEKTRIVLATTMDLNMNGTITDIKLAGQCRHLFSHIDKKYVVYHGRYDDNMNFIEQTTTANSRWFDEEQLRTEAISTAMKKVFNVAVNEMNLKTDKKNVSYIIIMEK
ncbi:unnamed protein product [Didymodactylos carnosus]|uniref:Adenine DNA glycosylase n=1 Tax=Didymodactylos carnosus TaxID=1234261 RepID=A0A814RK84_9BILA|nr:unnamed protein product [Didymodactylos carnosus]CAF1135246.1 unnamed protein product [Didymodactylos carnosus]CAF3512749.1 unnamed protein product [Didymodactylos carnosus]CAF3898931.1 unnamed protein product [Didymodactylos carnosus]